jgi:hypothetical protein
MAGLDLVTTELAQRLVGRPAAGGGVLVNPKRPETSVLYTKLTPTPPFGSRMPTVGGPLDDATTACVLGWVKTLEAAAPDAGFDAAVDAPDAHRDASNDAPHADARLDAHGGG